MTVRISVTRINELFSDLEILLRELGELSPNPAFRALQQQRIATLRTERVIFANFMVLRGAQIYRDELRRAVPIRTGRLRNSIQVIGRFEANEVLFIPVMAFYGRPLNALNNWIVTARDAAKPQILTISNQRLRILLSRIFN